MDYGDIYVSNMYADGYLVVVDNQELSLEQAMQYRAEQSKLQGVGLPSLPLEPNYNHQRWNR